MYHHFASLVLMNISQTVCCDHYLMFSVCTCACMHACMHVCLCVCVCVCVFCKVTYSTDLAR